MRLRSGRFQSQDTLKASSVAASTGPAEFPEHQGMVHSGQRRGKTPWGKKRGSRFCMKSRCLAFGALSSKNALPSARRAGYTGGQQPPTARRENTGPSEFFRKDAQETERFWVERLGVEGGGRLCPLLQNFPDHLNFITNAYVSLSH